MARSEITADAINQPTSEFYEKRIKFKSIVRGKLISCPGYGKSESRDSIEAVDSTVESEKSNLKLLNSNKIILSNLQRKKRPLDEQSSGK